MNDTATNVLALSIRTDKPEAEVGLYTDTDKVAYLAWQAHRQLAETIHQKIEEILHASDKQIQDLGGIVVYEGPGSFTGLRIGISVANALAYSLGIPVVAASGENWAEKGLVSLPNQQLGAYAVPAYGGTANITRPKK